MRSPAANVGSLAQTYRLRRHRLEMHFHPARFPDCRSRDVQMPGLKIAAQDPVHVVEHVPVERRE